MNVNARRFSEYFLLALEEAVKEREYRIVALRYGLTGGKCHTLEQIGQVIGISRERVRQLHRRTLGRVVGKGRRQIYKGQRDAPCAALLLFVQDAVYPNDSDVVVRLVDLNEEILSCLPPGGRTLPLISYLAFQDLDASKSYVTEAQKLIRQRRHERGKRHKREKLSKKFRILLSDVIWPKEISLLTQEYFETLTRARDVSLDGEGISGSYYSEKLDRVVQYESDLELNFLLRLEELSEVALYQEQPFRIFYTVNNRKSLYYPDILLVLNNGCGIVVEIKPVFKMALKVNLVKWTALKIFCAERGFGLLVTDGKRSIQQVMRHNIQPQFEEAILSALQYGSLSWSQYKRIRKRYDVTEIDFLALILRHKLVWQLNPFILSLPNERPTSINVIW